MTANELEQLDKGHTVRYSTNSFWSWSERAISKRLDWT